MKKLFFISTTIIFTLLMSCRSDTNSDYVPLMLYGNWQPDKIVTVTTQDQSSTTTTVNSNECQKKSRIVFNSNSTGHATYYDDSNGTCSVVLEVDFTYTFNPENGYFTLTTNGNTMEGEVTDLTNSNMVVYYVDKSNPTVTTKVEISATKVGK